MRSLLIGLMLLGAGPALAQSSDWAFGASLYGWPPGLSAKIETDFGTVEPEPEPGGATALSALDFAFMGVLEAQRGKWSLIGDLLHAELSATQDTPLGLAFEDADVAVRTSALSGYALYRVYEDPRVAIDLGGGARGFSVDFDVDLNSAGAVADQGLSTGSDWVDPLIAARFVVPFNERWFSTALVDFGGAGGGDQTWQALASVGYRFNDRWSTQVAYRHLGLRREVGGGDVSLDLYGPLVGVTARF